MTSQVVLLNRVGVAFASDSAVTLSRGGEVRLTRNSMTKLWDVSGHHNVAALLSGNVTLNGIYEHEFLFREWASSLPEEPLSTLASYSRSLVEWLHASASVLEVQRLEDNAQMSFVARSVSFFLNALFENEQQLGIEGLELLLQKQTEDNSSAPRYVDEGSEHLAALRSSAETMAESVVENVRELKQIDLSTIAESISAWIAGTIAANGIDSHATLALAGFGKEELMPSVAQIDIGGWCGGAPLLRTHPTGGGKSLLGSGLVVPLAQDDEMNLFLSGYPTWLFDVCHEAVRAEFDRRSPPDADPAVVLDDEQFMTEISRRIEGRVRGFSRRHYVHPMLSTISRLTIGELASVAESLVALECFRKLIAGEPATVGGPIDVAVITRHQGVQWVRKKDPFVRS